MSYEENRPVISLSSRVEELVAKFKELKLLNDELRQEIVSLKAQGEAKDLQIAKLTEQLQEKDFFDEEMSSQIEEVLNLV